MPTVVAESLSKTYRVADKDAGLRGTLRHFIKRKHREIEAVRGLSLSIGEGEVVGFLGANGAGKTTAIKMLTGLVHPTSGGVRVLGFEPFRRKAQLLRQITLVMGNKQQLLWDLPAMDSLRVNAAVYAIPPEEAEKRIRGFGEMLSLDKELTQPVRKLSLGERMKCELVAALLHHPKVLFLDEPTLGLDVNAQVAVRAFLKTYNAERGASILLTSHYMADITALCERVVVIDHGKVLYDGRLSGVVERFAPLREVTVELGREVTAEELGRFAQVESVEGRRARLLVPRLELPGVVGRILGELEVKDLTVADPPIEDVIARLFAEGKTADAERVASDAAK